MAIVNFPTTLTLIRLVVSPLILPLLLVYFLPINHILINGILVLFFFALSLTDFFDGYLARKYGQETLLGAVLDPIADKFLVYSTLIGLLVVNKIYFFWVVLLIGREFFLMGLRQVALENNFSVPVSFLGKLKTATQIICLMFIIFNPYQTVGLGLSGVAWWNTAELILIVITVGISMLSALFYYQAFIGKFLAKHESDTIVKAHKS
ncbi:MAG: CDP-diacylglycerol--glycerol-3-phosphate 3-phosphatidyltransferase [Candidatus Dependentiae bacterium]|nr:CDP-diacylglycerol--glycerol-3-phosphate 3-phosphatidyltransferase [Candidatus Dependentiae bacterium]